jgi:hypothetical protein
MKITGMNTRLAIIFLFLAISLGTAQHAQPAGSKHAGSDQTSKTQTQKPEKPDSGCQAPLVQQTFNCEPANQPRESVAANPADHPHDWIDKVNAFSTLVIALFTILLFLGVIWQVNTSRDTERAWVIATPTDNAPVVGFIPGGESNLERHLEGANKQNVFGCSFKTTGSSPARLVETAIRYCKVDSLQDIPSEPDFGDRTPLNDLPLVPGDSLGFIQLLEPSPTLTRIEWVRITRQEAFLYAFGILVYQDAYGRLHETRFGFVYHFPKGDDMRWKGFHREGLPVAYNHAT